MKKPNPSNPVWRLLRYNISPAQLTGYGLANILGLAILLAALQFYRDVGRSWSGEDTLISRDYLIITKHVEGGLTSLLSGAGGNASEFGEKEIDDIESQSWCGKVGRFTAASCNVSASVDFGGRGMSTFLFLESIPDDFFDVRPSGWGFDPEGDRTVPIILSKDYLALYNFGFAPSRGLPQLSEGMVSMVPLRLTLSGNGQSRDFRGKIVGFSSRLNTIAVPEKFIEWANGEYSDGVADNPSRLIIETKVAGDPAIDQYLEEHGYEVAGDKVSNGRAAFFLRVLTGVVGAIGVVISLLSFFILILSIWLLLQKNREKIHQLLMLGYSPSDVAKYYGRIICGVNLIVVVIALGITFLASICWREPLSAIGVDSSSLFPTILTGLLLMTGVTALNLWGVRRKILRFW